MVDRLRSVAAIPYFWYRSSRIIPASVQFEGVDTFEDLLSLGPVLGFNGQTVRAYLIWRLAQWYDATMFVETGTSYGHTSAYVEKAFNIPVYSCEAQKWRHYIGTINLALCPGVRTCYRDSRTFLGSLCRSIKSDERPLFYLDAHWLEDLPLAEELRTIAQNLSGALVLVDDCHMPFEPDFEFDTYPDGRIDVGYMQEALQPESVKYSFRMPDYGPDKEPVERPTGMAVVAIGQVAKPFMSLSCGMLSQPVSNIGERSQ